MVGTLSHPLQTRRLAFLRTPCLLLPCLPGCMGIEVFSCIQFPFAVLILSPNAGAVLFTHLLTGSAVAKILGWGESEG